MIQVYLVDISAEARQELNAFVEQFNSYSNSELEYAPRLAIKLMSPSELKFHPRPDLVIVGSELVTQELSLLGSLKRSCPQSAFLVCLPEGLDKLSSVEQILRIGADDVISRKVDAQQFYQKILVHSQKSRQSKLGKLVLVDSGKGGVGVSSLVAGLGEALSESGKRVCLVDLDFDSQDLTRFLQVRPFINENLELLLRGQRAVNQEFVMQTVFPVWEADRNLFCVPPITDSELIYEGKNGFSRAFVSVLEVLDSSFDVVLVDVASARASLLQTLYHVADTLVFVLSGDPASFYSSSAKLSRYRGLLAQNAPVILVENALRKDGLPIDYLKQELEKSLGSDGILWANTVPFNRSAMRWPGSGDTIFSACHNSPFKESLVSILRLSGLWSGQQEETFLDKLKSKLRLSEVSAKSTSMERPSASEKLQITQESYSVSQRCGLRLLEWVKSTSGFRKRNVEPLSEASEIDCLPQVNVSNNELSHTKKIGMLTTADVKGREPSEKLFSEVKFS